MKSPLAQILAPRTAVPLTTVSVAAPPLSDFDVAQRIAAGDQDELQRLMRRYNQRLYRTARSILRDDAEAEDTVQESYLLAYKAMSQFRGDAKLSTWLVGSWRTKPLVACAGAAGGPSSFN